MPLTEQQHVNVQPQALGRKKQKLAKKKAKAHRQRAQKCAWDADAENADPNQDSNFVPATKAFKAGDEAAKWYNNVFAEESTAELRSELVSAEPVEPTEDADANSGSNAAARHDSIVPRDWSTWYTDQFGQTSEPVAAEESKEERPKLLQLPQASNLDISWGTEEYMEENDARFGVAESKEEESKLLQLPQVSNLDVSWDTEEYMEETDAHFGVEENGHIQDPIHADSASNEDSWVDSAMKEFEEIENGTDDCGETPTTTVSEQTQEEIAEVDSNAEQLAQTDSNPDEEQLAQTDSNPDEEQLAQTDSNPDEEQLAQAGPKKKAMRVFKPKPSTRPLTKPCTPKFATSKRAQRVVNNKSTDEVSMNLRKYGADLSKNMLRSVSVTIPVSPHFATAGRKRSASVLSTVEQEEQYIQEHQFKAQPVNAGLQQQQQHGRGPRTGPVGSRTRARTAARRKLTCPRGPKLQSAARSRAHTVLSTAELEEQYMQEHQFKPRAVGEGVPETTCGGGGAALTLTKPKSPALSTASRKRPAAALSRDELEEEYMRTHQFKPRAVGEGVSEAASGASRATRSSRRSKSFKPTIAQAPKLSTSSRRRPASALSRDELEEEYMRTHQFKPRAVGEGVPTGGGGGRGKRAKTAQEAFQPTVPVPPKLRTSSRRRAAAVLSTEEYEEQYMQEHQFKARPFYK